MPVAGMLALSLTACAGGSSASPAPTVPTLAELSLVPALTTPSPAPVESLGGPPPIGPPSGVPAPPPQVTADYPDGADDLGAFVAAYREAFSVPELSENDIAAAGARLCTYLQRHADAGGVVDLGAAITEADVNEPGYPYEAWRLAFELAGAHYCRELAMLSSADE